MSKPCPTCNSVMRPVGAGSCPTCGQDSDAIRSIFAAPARLDSVEARYKDLLDQLGVQGHDGATAEIAALRSSASLAPAAPTSQGTPRTEPLTSDENPDTPRINACLDSTVEHDDITFLKVVREGRKLERELAEVEVKRTGTFLDGHNDGLERGARICEGIAKRLASTPGFEDKVEALTVAAEALRTIKSPRSATAQTEAKP